VFLSLTDDVDACVQDLHFVSAPHTLPLQDGQSIAMRAWWRHWNVGTEDALAYTLEGQLRPSSIASTSVTSSTVTAPQQTLAASAGTTAAASLIAKAAGVQEQLEQPQDEELPAPLVEQLQHQPSLLHGQARQEEISTMMAAGWEAVVLQDWSVSLRHLNNIWSSTAQELDGVLGFSNGAAAAFLFAAHAAAHPETFGSLRFVALAGGYVPEPLEKLLHPSLLAGSASSCADSNDSSVPPVSRLKAPLPFPSLHMMGSNDPLIDVDVATQLMDCFQVHGRWDPAIHAD
jgi:dienelactone hydrolase